jgi:hypothetical protein
MGIFDFGGGGEKVSEDWDSKFEIRNSKMARQTPESSRVAASL